MGNWLRWVGGLGCLCLGLTFAQAQVIPSPGPPTAIGCAFNTSLPILASGQAGWVQCDQYGRAITVTTSPQGVTQGITAAGSAARVSQEPSQIFWDDFATGTLDTTAKWTAPTTGGGGNATAANNQVGATTLGSGTTASGWSILSTQYTFTGKNPSWLYFQEQNNFEFPVLTNATRFWGFATFPAAPTAAAPYADAVGFELGTDGHLRAITSASPNGTSAGTKTTIADLSIACANTNPYGGPLGLTNATSGCAATQVGKIAQPQDSGVHKYIIYFRGDNIYWAIDGVDNIVAYTINGAPGPNVNSLPIGHIAVANTPTGPTSSATITINATTIGDTGKNEIRICDPVNPWRCMTVNKDSGASVANSVSSITGSISAATITNASTQFLAAASRRLLSIDNESTTATIACAFGATAAINTAGSFTLVPGTTRVWNSYPVPADAVNCISSAATSPATVEAN